MKIGIACYPTFGGSGVVATELGHELAVRGHDVHFISYALPSRLNLFAERVSYHEVTVPTCPLVNYPPYDLALATRIVDVALLRDDAAWAAASRAARERAVSRFAADAIVGRYLAIYERVLAEPAAGAGG